MVVFKPVMDVKEIDGDDGIPQFWMKTSPSVIEDFELHGCAVPDISRIYYNLGEKKIWKLDDKGVPVRDENGKKILDRKYKTLTTIVYWVTGEKTVVTNSEVDGLKLDADGNVSVFSKECGLAFAVMKRIFAGKYSIDNFGNTTIEDSGFGGILNKLIKNSYDCNEEEKKRKLQKEKTKKRLEAEKANAKPKVENPSLAASARSLKESVDILAKMVEDLKNAR